VSCSEIAKAENEIRLRLTPRLSKRLAATLPVGKTLCIDRTIELLAMYLYFVRRAGGDPDKAIRKYLAETKSSIQKVKKKSEALRKCIKAFMIEPSSLLLKGSFSREFDFLEVRELLNVLDDLEVGCDEAVAHIGLKGLQRGRRLDRVRWAFLKQSLRIWVLSSDSVPPITSTGRLRQKAAARKNGSFADFISLIEELVPEDCKPSPINEDFLKDGIASLRSEMIAFRNSGGQFRSNFPALDP